jgi:hypothetical protein
MRALAQRCAPAVQARPARSAQRRATQLGADAVLELQRQVGNRAVAALLTGQQRGAGRPHPVVQRYEVQDCGPAATSKHPANEVHAAHGRARTMVSIAEMESASSTDPAVTALAMKHFKLRVPPVSNTEKKLWYGRVRQVLTALHKRNSEAVYECEPQESWKHGMCSAGTIAMTLLNIHLCPKWWTLSSLDDRAFVLIHEWAHRFGPSVNQIFETYCDAKDYGGLSASELVAEPDAYASYVFELVTGTAPSKSVC